ncbi:MULTISPECIES: hypothetical protein [Brucella/Ochrobactrum group]|jgi:hypothetical protein|uniref:hypothetical protein n=1 Tax=Brucella/Ochrobactrum group TaxID=2826938 RepID=UPI001C03C412|nr:hypothetical protein [Brucella sp. NBRC 12950]QWK81063.1 hypothetical protein KMS41_21125 [Ochrobactrum sp. BTU1]
MQFLYDYSVFLDGLALFALVCLAVAAAVQNKSVIMAIVAIIVSIWSVVRFFGLI